MPNYERLDQREIESAPPLRPTTPEEMLAYIIPREETHISVQRAQDGELVTVPEEWTNGGGLRGDALVNFHDLLTMPLAGTELSAYAYISWFQKDGAEFTSEEGEITAQRAVALLNSDAMFLKRKREPILRILRPGEPGRVPIAIEYYGGAENSFMQSVSAIGNLENPDGMQKLTYRGEIAALFNQFITKGTGDMRKLMGVPDDMPRIRRLDDVGAAITTFWGDKALDEVLHGPSADVFEITDVAIGTTHMGVLATRLADKRKRPLLLRVGAPAMGLLGENVGLNYIGNTQPKMLQYGPLTCGDVGTLLDEGENKDKSPHIVPGITPDTPFQIRLFLGGGWPIYKIALAGYKDHQDKPMPPVVFIRAKRVDNGPKEWGVLMSGMELTRQVHQK